MFRRTVKCVDCGYLCKKAVETSYAGESTTDWGSGRVSHWPQYDETVVYREVPPTIRRAGPAELEEVFGDLLCWRHAAQFSQERPDFSPVQHIEDEDEKRSAVDQIWVNAWAEPDADLHRKRGCELFFRYAPGYPAHAHLSLQEKRQSEWLNRWWNLAVLLIGSGLGSGLTLLGAALLR